MIPWYIITLEDEPWKLPLTLEHLKGFGITPKVIYGINGFLAGLKPTTPHDVDPDGKYRFMHTSQAGCVISHLMALTLAIADGAEQFIIAEDDIVLGKDFNADFDRWYKALPDDTQIFQMQHYGFHQSPGLYQCINSFGTACILWKRDAARQAMRMLRPIESPFDVMLIRKVYPFLKHFVVEPALVTERTSAGEWPSSITR